ncbi:MULTISPECIES: ABC transporter ATP-binding protein [Amycolatopsis]|uniref:High-affinity branched-chain amino acid transport ATP-binding protein LivF n=1 Tax=Amycolatopsis japonica TaxID=208439 RepID=A0A075V803_9PSEU|nr:MULTISPECIES: ABC transporter ATP-binding protein [Amycolatopsis]AIG79010.1 High-affinity branched-chain amino acid transport ATP-binding protein LivF [Amycolatopsis japonica]OKJ93256.1 branched-chain amino acid ABC transporter ATP-binding protein [Amycolatopsis sp. CB00013]
MLSVRDLQVRYGRSVAALHGVDLDVSPDGVLAVLGSNGAGKSTLLRTVSGTLRMHRGSVSAGEVRYDGKPLTKLDPARIVGLGVVGVPEGRQVFARMTVEENLRAGGIGARSPEQRAAARKRVDELFPVLSERAKQRAGLLSGGEQQMLAIGRALMSGPRLLLLDEPSLGLAPKIVERIGDIIREIHEQGTAVVLVEQNAVMALRVADHAIVLEVGRVALAGTTAELVASEEVQRLYLGGHAESQATAEAEAADARKHLAGRSLSRWAG